MTGNTSAAHVHFEMRVYTSGSDYRTVDPKRFFK
ncbi:MAG: hypothetical protein J6J21_01365 [Clostridia bacterium]|nr:hypothetical protein [Clostridia bacterium]